MSLIAGLYIIYHMYTFGVTQINAIALVLFIVSLVIDGVRWKKNKERVKAMSSNVALRENEKEKAGE